MVRLAAQDLKAPVDLLRQDDAHHLMREGHRGEGQFFVRPLADRRHARLRPLASR